MNSTGTLYVVATPVGNLEDITLRAVRILKEADLIAAEDTRTTKKLLNHLGINTPLTSYFEYNKTSKGGFLIGKLKEGKNIALVSDAGTPCISDSGYLLVDEALNNGLAVVSVPGPSAVIAALSISGLNTDRFIFLGFLKKKPSKKRKELEKYREEDKPLVFFESPYRILETLDEVKTALGNVTVVICREITKKFEEVARGSAESVKEYFLKKEILGEFVLIVEPSGVKGKKEEKEEE